LSLIKNQEVIEQVSWIFLLHMGFNKGKKAPMRIALVTDSFLPFVGGLEWKVHYLAHYYKELGHDVTVFAGRASMAHEAPLPIKADYDIVRCSYPIRGIDRIGIHGLLFRRALAKKHRVRPFTVLHCHPLTAPTQWGLGFKKRAGVPVVATACGGDVQVLEEIGYGNRLNKKLQTMLESNLKNVDVIGSISASTRKEIERLAPEARIVDIPNGVDWPAFQIERCKFLHEHMGIPENVTIILSLGRNHKKKGYELGIRAFADLAGQFPESVYVIVGRGTSCLEGIVRDLGMEKRIFLIPQIPMPRIPSVFRSADIFLNPSLMEGFAQVNAQALASGLPCVLTDAPGNIDAGLHGGALIGRSGSSDSIQEMLRVLLADPAKRRQLGEEAHRASSKYSWQTIAEAYIAVFQSLAEEVVRGKRKGTRP
jgi:glycosyltransferase involved in cell wall biosynthesis